MMRAMSQSKQIYFRRIERVLKGAASHRRVEILELVKRVPELSVADISERLDIGYINTSDHIRKLAIAGLVMKRNEGSSVRHKITPLGESILVFCKTLA